jgi:hypothetical protein
MVDAPRKLVFQRAWHAVLLGSSLALSIATARTAGPTAAQASADNEHKPAASS